jgi:hypothetical protein
MARKKLILSNYRKLLAFILFLMKLPACGRQWFKKLEQTDPGSNTVALFAIVTTMQVGNGRTTLFWTDRWLHRCSIADLAPSGF